MPCHAKINQSKLFWQLCGKQQKQLSNYDLYNKANVRDSQSSENEGEEKSCFLNLCKIYKAKK